MSEEWHIVHFIGHGDFDIERDEGVLSLVGSDGRENRVEASRLVDLLREARPMPRLVVLNSCASATSGTQDIFSGTAAALTRGGVSAVTAMQFEISDTAAIHFCRGFYTAIALGRGVDEAVRSGRVAILGANGSTLEWITPVLYLRSRDARLFEVEPRQRSTESRYTSPADSRATTREPEDDVRSGSAHSSPTAATTWTPLPTPQSEQHPAPSFAADQVAYPTPAQQAPVYQVPVQQQPSYPTPYPQQPVYPAPAPRPVAQPRPQVAPITAAEAMERLWVKSQDTIYADRATKLNLKPIAAVLAPYERVIGSCQTSFSSWSTGSFVVTTHTVYLAVGNVHKYWKEFITKVPEAYHASSTVVAVPLNVVEECKVENGVFILKIYNAPPATYNAQHKEKSIAPLIQRFMWTARREGQ